jgi:predicted ribosome-associated RNA-binding protein Tma20
MYENVENFLYKGANLMWPGVSNKDCLGEFKSDDIVKMYSSDDKLIGIGAFGCNSSDLEEDMKGVAAYSLCIINDYL